MMRIAIGWAGLALLAQQAGETTYYVGHAPKYVTITFESEADLETIVGQTKEAAGEVRADFPNETGSVSLTVPVDSLKTGIDKRDEDLRSEMWLDAKHFPTITFKSKKVEKVKDAKNRVLVTGEFTMHGVTKEIAVPVDWRSISEEDAKKAMFPGGRWLKLTTQFVVKLSDYGVVVPRMIVSHVADAWTVKMTIYAGTPKPETK